MITRKQDKIICSVFTSSFEFESWKLFPCSHLYHLWLLVHFKAFLCELKNKGLSSEISFFSFVRWHGGPLLFYTFFFSLPLDIAHSDETQNLVGLLALVIFPSPFFMHSMHRNNVCGTSTEHHNGHIHLAR